MTPVRFQIGISLDSESVAVLERLFQQVWEKATARLMLAMYERAESIHREEPTANSHFHRQTD